MTSNFRSSNLLIFIGALVVGAVSFQPVDAQKTKPKITYYSIKTGTTFRVRLEKEISSKTARTGDGFQTTTIDPVYSSGGVLLVPAGSTIHGTVTIVTRAAKNGKPGSFGATFTSVTLPNKRKAALIGMPVPLEDGKNTIDNEGTVAGKKTSKRNLKFIGGGAAGGAVIGGIAGGGSGAAIGAGVGAVAGLVGKNLLKGREAEVKSGTEFGVYLSKGIALPRYAGEQ